MALETSTSVTGPALSTRVGEFTLVTFLHDAKGGALGSMLCCACGCGSCEPVMAHDSEAEAREFHEEAVKALQGRSYMRL